LIDWFVNDDDGDRMTRDMGVGHRQFVASTLSRLSGVMLY